MGFLLHELMIMERRQISPWGALALIATAEILTLSVWFSASVVATPLQHLWDLDAFEVALLTAAVQLGFVVGAVASSVLAIADRYNGRRIFALSAIGGAVANALFVFSGSWETGMLLRLLTGVAMVGVYPVAVKLVAEWAPARRGAAVGILVAALTLGSALPHLILFAGINAPWQAVLLTSSGLALAGAAIIAFLLPEPPVAIRKVGQRVTMSSVRAVLANKAGMLADYGYFGHMWELYAMWVWFPAFVYASFVARGEHGGVAAAAALIGFFVIGIGGAFGSAIGGFLADRVGRTVVTSVAMAISGFCALVIGAAFGGPPWLVVGLGMVWGVAVIADSAQFSAAVTELSDPEYVGTALTLQTAVGFLITVVSINLIALTKGAIGWQWSFVPLAIGPFLGVYAMLRLRRHTSATALANGRR